MARVVMLAPAPRDVPLSVRASLIFGGPLSWIGWLFFAFGMIFVLAFGLPENVASIFWSLQPQQTVSGVATDSRATGASVNETAVYEIRFSFIAADGRIYHGRSYATGTEVQAGEPVRIEYPAASPAHATIQGMRRSMFGPAVLLITIFPGIGLIFVLWGIVQGRRNCYLLENGRLAMGTKTAKERTNTRVNKQYVYRLTFEFTGDDGQTHQAFANTTDTSVLEDETQEALLYDPQQPARAVMLDNLAGSPEFDDSGNIQAKGLGAWLGAVVLPALVIAGLAYYFWRQS